MIKIKVRTLYDIKKILGKREVDILVPAGSTVRDCLDKMVEIWGEKLSAKLFDANGEDLWSHIQIFVNSVDVKFMDENLKTVVKKGDEIMIIPPAFGG